MKQSFSSGYMPRRKRSGWTPAVVLRRHIRKTSDGCTAQANPETTTRRLMKKTGRSLEGCFWKTIWRWMRKPPIRLMHAGGKLSRSCGITSRRANWMRHGFTVIIPSSEVNSPASYPVWLPIAFSIGSKKKTVWHNHLQEDHACTDTGKEGKSRYFRMAADQDEPFSDWHPSETGAAWITCPEKTRKEAWESDGIVLLIGKVFINWKSQIKEAFHSVWLN